MTPKKVGQFVTFWKRNPNGKTEPYSENDQFDFYVINIKSENRFGQFVFPKSELINKGYVTSEKKDGKRGFRVYPIWEKVLNKQAATTQKWQLNYFYEINEKTDLKAVRKLYNCDV
ncbi:MepB family protein [Galbibacter mesophilus]|uniref:MepB family protein n=1 Tax=Galbibacter mesophilus TaxID=379069 RepID=UPI002042C74B|nr:MepB family protein [Galbibacter mesophilus]MCM5661667.1 MepB family protein [Galbibacter mesophilus]